MHFRYRTFLFLLIPIVVVFLAILSTNDVVLDSFARKVGIIKPTPAPSELTVGNLISEINKKRIEAGVGTLAENYYLNKAANEKANEIFANNSWNNNFNEKNTWKYVKESGYNYVFAGLLLARDYTSAFEVVNGWMNSSNKTDLLDSKYIDLGLNIRDGTNQGESTNFVVLFLANKKINNVVLSAQTQIINNQTNYIDCIGPDGKHFQTTQKECDDFNAAWDKSNWAAQIPTTNKNTSSEPKASCYLSTGIWQLTAADCSWMKDFEAGLTQDMAAYRQANDKILQDFDNKVNAMPTYSPSQPLVVEPLPTWPTIQEIPSPKDCYPVNNTGMTICK